MKPWEEFLGRADLFSGLGPKDREALLAASAEMELRRKKTLAHSSSAPNIHLLAQGALKTIRQDLPSSRLVMDFLGPGDLVGEEALLGVEETEFTIAAVEHSVLLSLPVDHLRRLLDLHPRFSRAFAALAAARARAYRERLYFFSAAPVHVRLASLLLQLGRRFGKRDKKGTMIALHVTHQDFADYIGASRETVTLAFSKFKEKGLLDTNVRRIIIPDFKTLKKAAQLK